MKNITIDGVEYNITPVIKEIKKDYEILSLSFTNNFCYLQKNGEYAYRNTPNITSTLKVCLSVGWKIHSVKRIFDGEIFTIGDKTNFGLISKIVINNNSLSFYFEQKSCGYNLQTLIKWKPLFTTEDGVDIFEDDKVYFVNKIGDVFHTNHLKIKKYQSHLLYFSTKEKAEEYILLNKPCLSYGDVQEYLKVKDCNKVLDLAQSKIQQSV